MAPPYGADATPLSNTPAVPEQTGAAAGSMGSASRADHVHPRLTSVNWWTLNASSEATVTFTQAFATKPGIDCIYEEATDNPPVMFKVKSWVQDGSNNYVGCVIKGYRGQVIPQNLANLLLSAVFNTFGASASGVSFSCIAVKQSS